MAGNTKDGNGRRGSHWRIAAWAAAGLILLIPLIAMQFTDEVRWNVADFVVAGALLLSVGVPLELTVGKTGNAAYRWAVGVALATAFLLIWVNVAVGILGSEHNDANVLYGGVLVIGFVGALLSRFRPLGMTYAMAATALAQAAVAVGALVAGWGALESGAFEVLVLNGFFVALWAGSAVLFREAAQEQSQKPPHLPT